MRFSLGIVISFIWENDEYCEIHALPDQGGGSGVLSIVFVLMNVSNDCVSRYHPERHYQP
jgi:hypothetical protein